MNQELYHAITDIFKPSFKPGFGVWWGGMGKRWIENEVKGLLHDKENARIYKKERQMKNINIGK